MNDAEFRNINRLWSDTIIKRRINMKKAILAAVVFSAFAVSAQATGLNFGDTYNDPTYNKGGTGVGIAGAAAGASASVKSSNENRNANSNKNQQGQGQGQKQSTDNANNSKQRVNVEGDTYEARRIPVSTAYAPSIAPTAPCMGSTSGGAQGAGFGFSIGGTWTDKNCELLEQVRAVGNAGEPEVAREMLMGVPAYAEAKQRIADRKSGKTAAKTAFVSVNAVPSNGYTGDDPIVRARLGLPPLK